MKDDVLMRRFSIDGVTSHLSSFSWATDQAADGKPSPIFPASARMIPRLNSPAIARSVRHLIIDFDLAFLSSESGTTLQAPDCHPDD